eukprot:CAMPEP_0176237598 /NCGR_PEP_ID=MMETSP0121_2-20121125/27931_1 /TAXON_ID=160619 /ORGANISM="Kryptoperidinium foliaceum, Strain CCMP 1326" /LENGTH=36 /DNA_ID= /DNA_START= /DNA_END= /DNA_ORIENTATION=
MSPKKARMAAPPMAALRNAAMPPTTLGIAGGPLPGG